MNRPPQRNAVNPKIPPKAVNKAGPSVKSENNKAKEAKSSFTFGQKIGCFGVIILLITAVVLILQACSEGILFKGNKTKENITETEQEFKLGTATYFFATDSTKEMPDNIESPYAVLISRKDGQIVAERNADEKVYPASLTKIMTLIVGYENGNLDDSYIFTNSDLYPLYAENASVAGFKEGEEVTLKDLLYGLILPSGADGAVGIANLVAGGEEEFAELMNEKAAEMGLKNTHFANSSGLHDENQYSTVTELATILDYALQYDFCREVLSTYKYTTSSTNINADGIVLTSDIQSKMEGSESGVAHISGGKTGYTIEAKNCLASFGTVDETGDEYIIVTCGVSGEFKPIFDAINIYRDFFGDGSTYTGPGT